MTDFHGFDDPLLRRSSAFEKMMRNIASKTIVELISITPASGQELHDLSAIRDYHFTKRRKTVANGKPEWQLEYQHREPKAKKWTNASISKDDSWTGPQTDRIVQAIHTLFERMPVLAGGVALYRIIRDLAQLVIGLDSEHPKVLPFEIVQSRGERKNVDAWVSHSRRHCTMSIQTPTNLRCFVSILNQLPWPNSTSLIYRRITSLHATPRLKISNVTRIAASRKKRFWLATLERVGT